MENDLIEKMKLNRPFLKDCASHLEGQFINLSQAVLFFYNLSRESGGVWVPVNYLTEDIVDYFTEWVDESIYRQSDYLNDYPCLIDQFLADLDDAIRDLDLGAFKIRAIDEVEKRRSSRRIKKTVTQQDYKMFQKLLSLYLQGDKDIASKISVGFSSDSFAFGDILYEIIESIDEGKGRCPECNGRYFISATSNSFNCYSYHLTWFNKLCPLGGKIIWEKK